MNAQLFSLNELPAIVENGKIFAFSPNEKKLFVFPLSTPRNLWPNNSGVVYPYGPINDIETFYLTIVLTPACNLTCSYCSLPKGKMEAFVSANAIIDYFQLLAETRKESRFIVAFFGGEPTLEKEKMRLFCETFSRITEQNHKTIHFTMTTNGTFDNTIMDILIEYDFSLLLSMDGPADIHNFQRNGSHGIVEENLKRLLISGIDVTISSVVTSFSVDKWKNVAEYFYTLGVTSLQYNPVFPFPWSEANIKKDSRFSRPSVEKYVESALGIYLFGIERGVQYSNPVFARMFHPTRYYCDLQAGYQALLINYNGDILNCAEVQNHHHPLYQQSLLGNISKKIIIQSQNHRTEDIARQCVDCPLIFICCAGCPKRRALLHNTKEHIDRYYCEISKKLIEMLLRYWAHQHM